MENNTEHRGKHAAAPSATAASVENATGAEAAQAVKAAASDTLAAQAAPTEAAAVTVPCTSNETAAPSNATTAAASTTDASTTVPATPAGAAAAPAEAAEPAEPTEAAETTAPDASTSSAASATSAKTAKPATSRKTARIAIVAALIAVLGGAGAFVALHDSRIAQDAQNSANSANATAQLPVNPKNIAALKAENPDIYAWISIPGTKVDYPILQSSEDDNYYFRRDVSGEYSENGALYTQSMNSTDFDDPVTVVYGHYATDDSMFATLHYFENVDFFKTYQTMYVYTMHHILTYQVIAAYEYDDRHIMNSYDFSDESVRLKYFDSVLHPTSMLVNVREGVELTADSKLLQLSTCMSAYVVSNTRYIVTGLLINDQPTQ